MRMKERGNRMKAILPFEVKVQPLTKLALINFENNPDQVYCGLELQYIEGSSMGRGYRVIAYRNDKYVDVYDEETIRYIPEEKFDVTQKGLKQHVHRKLEHISLDSQKGKVHISFAFTDCENRIIEVEIKERAKRKSTPMNLLAPIGVCSEKPTYLPVFFLYDFDFVRRSKTDRKVLINGVNMRLDPFPYPITMNLQRRLYTRYSLDSQIVEFLNTDSKQVKEIELNNENQYTEGPTEYQFTNIKGTMALSSLQLKDIAHPLKIEFEPPISLETCQGDFHILPEERMGRMDGSYKVTEEGENVFIKVVPEKGWKAVPNSLVTRLIFSENSVFCNWSRKYVFEQKINMRDLSSESKWVNLNINQTDKFRVE